MADRENPWAQMFEAAGDDALRALNQREHERANARLHLTPAQAAGLAAGRMSWCLWTCFSLFWMRPQQTASTQAVSACRPMRRQYPDTIKSA